MNIWKKALLAPLLVSMAMPCRAQATISAVVPNGGAYLKPQLWNLSVANADRAAVSAQVRMQMVDIQTHETVLSAVTTVFSVPPGAKLLRDGALQPIQYSYGAGTAGDRSPNGMLPVGQYQVCYQLYLLQEQTVPASDDCVQLQVEPLSPPLLAMPEDGDTVATATPAFTWVPPAPLNMFGNLNYDLLLTEVYPGQSPTDAVQKNLPIQQATSLGRPFLQYPMQSQRLDTGKLYAWQVTARDGDRFAARSEVWTFRLKGDSTKTTVKSNFFVKLSEKALAPTTVTDGKLRIEYDNATLDSTVRATITGNAQGGGRPITFKLKVRYGQNFIEHDLENIKLTEGTVYELRIVDGMGNIRYMRFIPQYKH